MIDAAVTDWDDAYANAPNIPGGARWPDLWVAPAKAFRQAARGEVDLPYGEHPRARFDLFRPDGDPRGVFVFIHGGFWMKLDKSYWSHLAAAALARGFAAAIPSYPLCPEARIRDIAAMAGAAVKAAAARFAGPILLAGHSAGGHLVTRMLCEDAPLPPQTAARIARAASISGLHDLRPLMRCAMNATLRLDAEEARVESPALRDPATGASLLCWVGADERPEFIRQNALLANIWRGAGLATAAVEEPQRHHFDVVDGLADPNSALARALFDGIA